jgi:hypothetical protein
MWRAYEAAYDAARPLAGVSVEDVRLVASRVLNQYVSNHEWTLCHHAARRILATLDTPDRCENGHTDHADCTDECACVGSGNSAMERADPELVPVDEESPLLKSGTYPVVTPAPTCEHEWVGEQGSAMVFCRKCKAVEQCPDCKWGK